MKLIPPILTRVQLPEALVYADPDDVEILIRRSRDKEGFELLTDTVKEIGVVVPVQAVDRGPNYPGKRYLALFGEGRKTACKRTKTKLPLSPVKASPVEFVSRFLAENLIRQQVSWSDMGRLIRDAVNDGQPLEDVAKQLHISLDHAKKYLRVLNKMSPDVEEAAREMPMNDAEVLTTIPPKGQSIVIQVARETGASVKEVAEKAKEVAADKGEGWTKTELRKSITGIDDTKRRLVDKARVLRLHHSLGPMNLMVLLQRPAFRTAIKRAGVNIETFEQLTKDHDE